MRFFLAFLLLGCAFNAVYSMKMEVDETGKKQAQIIGELVGDVYLALEDLKKDTSNPLNVQAVNEFAHSCADGAFEIPEGDVLEILRNEGLVRADAKKVDEILAVCLQFVEFAPHQLSS